MGKIGSLFSGYGGLDMAVAQVTGAETAWVSDIDKDAPVRCAAHTAPSDWTARCTCPTHMTPPEEAGR